MSRYIWDMRPTEINAYYSAQSNKIGEYEFLLHSTPTNFASLCVTTRAQVPPSSPSKMPLKNCRQFDYQTEDCPFMMKCQCLFTLSAK